MKDELTDVRMPIGVALFGMDERSTARMATIFKIVYKGRCEFAQGEDANLGIVDLDVEANAWDKFQCQYPGLPAIVMSETPKEVEGAIYVAKPAKLDLLWESIFNLVMGLPPVDEIGRQAESTDIPSPVENEGAVTATSESKKLGASAAADAMDAQFKTARTGTRSVQRRAGQDEAALYFNPDDYLLGRILSSIKENAERECAIHVQCWRDRRLILLPGHAKAFTDLTDSQLKNLGVATVNEVNSSCEVKQGEPSKSELDGLRSMSIDYLIWDLALRTARGRVPEGTPESSPLYLRCWPNFTRLPRTPHDMRIASFWVNNPCTLDDIAVNLGIKREDVFSFYSAAAAIGLANLATRKVDGLIAPPSIEKKQSSKRGLFASILRHISG